MQPANFINSPEYLNISMKEFNVIIEKGEDDYLISEVIELPGCHSQAKSYDELIKRTKKAIALFLKCQDKPIKIKDKFVGLQKIAL
ncbi:MAG: type II toxin-antitoxin system HicB family antitoxin [Nanoarchaeota archaeon]|nr:type II toxin-antitoxin system HicB family antitoxin [Nanoarchaeota archaeon]